MLKSYILYLIFKKSSKAEIFNLDNPTQYFLRLCLFYMKSSDTLYDFHLLTPHFLTLSGFQWFYENL